jgi:acyl-CoA dehydrogenase
MVAITDKPIATDTGDTGRLIGETTRRLMQPHCSSVQLKDAEGSWSEPLWRELDDTGFTRALVPSGAGDLEIPIADALSIIRIAGSFSAPVPLAESMLAHWMLQTAGLPAIKGPLSIAPVNAEERFELRPARSAWQLKGTASRVPWGRYSATVVVAAEVDGKSFIAAVPCSSFLDVVHGENLAREPRDQIRIDASIPSRLVAPFDPGVEGIYTLGAAMRVLQMTGALDSVLRLTVQYAQDRKQFGRAIGKFQAVQQNVAVMAANIAAARAAANSVVRIIAESGSSYGIAAAKLRTNEAATIAAKIAHQVHGAMGFTQEYELHFLTKRLWSWRDEFGSEAVWGRKLGRAVCERGPDQLWAFITSEMT